MQRCSPRCVRVRSKRPLTPNIQPRPLHHPMPCTYMHAVAFVARAFASVLNDLSPRIFNTHRFTELYNYPKYSVPFKRGSRYFYFMNSGLQNQRYIHRHIIYTLPIIIHCVLYNVVYYMFSQVLMRNQRCSWIQIHCLRMGLWHYLFGHSVRMGNCLHMV